MPWFTGSFILIDNWVKVLQPSTQPQTIFGVLYKVAVNLMQIARVAATAVLTKAIRATPLLVAQSSPYARYDEGVPFELDDIDLNVLGDIPEASPNNE